MPRERAEQFCMMLAIHFELGQFARMRAVIDWAEREVLQGRSPEAPDFSSRPVADIGLGVRTVNALEELGIRTLGELLQTDEQFLQSVPNVGPKVIQEIRAVARRAIGRSDGAGVMPGAVMPGTAQTAEATEGAA
jgi:DNA-directed RNA polymerase alpha subunit